MIALALGNRLRIVASFASLVIASRVQAQDAVPPVPTVPVDVTQDTAAPEEDAGDTDGDGITDRPADRLSAFTALPEKSGRRVTHAIRDRVIAIPWITHALRTTERDGTEDLMIVLEVSNFETCVRALAPEGRAALRAAREQCRGDHGVTTSIAHVRLGPTPAGRPQGFGGDVTLVALNDTLFEGMPTGVSDFRYEDLDGDGRREVAIQFVVAGEITREPGDTRHPAFRTMPLVEHFVVLDGDLRAELSVVAAQTEASSFDSELNAERTHGRLRQLRFVSRGSNRYELEVRARSCDPSNERCAVEQRIRFEYDAASDSFRRATNGA